MLTRPDKDALRAMLESQVQEKLEHDPDAVTTYAAQPEPERKLYTSKPTVQDKAFHKELEQMRADAEADFTGLAFAMALKWNWMPSNFRRWCWACHGSARAPTARSHCFSGCH